MRAFGLTEYGAPAVLHEVQLPEQHAGPGEVRVRVRAAAVNPVDAIIRSGGFAGNDRAIAEPVVPGTDVAGVLDEVGPEQPEGFDLVVGDSVTGFVVPDGSHGGYSERIVLPTLSVTRMPSSGSFARGAAFLSNALTAEITLEHLALEPGQTLAVTGAVGGYLVQLAAARGITVIADARPADAQRVRGLGAAVVLDRDTDFTAGVRDATNGRGADAVADPAVLTDQVVDAARDGGQVAFYLPTDVDPGRGISVFGSYVMRSNLRHDAIERLARSVERGELRADVADVVPAADAAAAHERLERGGLRGRLVLEF
ncbi:NADPH:quinone reductase-like Zn-dependent oxidoreductase [Curtobacterium sp. PhB42]|uniref:quinone oxidoreductase family protein n=1 Tax=unclassified Curtobacterium TaxID=257496 RepID=UPI001063D186|nr:MULTISPECIES: NADP-dependent oxidoreductase [unclassified Curtobacterium]TDW44488.1 NADPH:quinone reductase-like Zn-dependent oxidoreductase [Curtobacterium sp. PhB42]TDW54189.1 NADPH:quinone reductase-like Zn-dependent oxidoreductase [Curtobacterium sp. PhB190]